MNHFAINNTRVKRRKNISSAAHMCTLAAKQEPRKYYIHENHNNNFCDFLRCVFVVCEIAASSKRVYVKPRGKKFVKMP
jgi:hypothetical protein